METSLGELVSIDTKPIVEDELTKKMMPKARQLAAMLKEAKARGRYILLRFHHDADGISGAFALSEVLRFFSAQQNSAVYSVKDAIRDLNNISYEEKPLVVLLDFGMNKESLEGLKLLKAAGVGLILIDHHPPSDEATGIADFFLTPWEFAEGKDASRYVAGYLASEVAREMGASTDRCGTYAKIACTGDKSTVLEAGDRERKSALVLDYLAAHSGYGNNLRFYKSVLENSELFDSIYLQADEKIDEAADKVMRTMKERKMGDVSIYVLDLEKAVKKGEFPNRSKIASKVFERLKRDTPLVVFGAGEQTVIMRINDAAHAKGIVAGSIAQKILEIMPDFAESGGGHGKAGAIRVKKGFVGAVVEEIVKMIGMI